MNLRPFQIFLLAAFAVLAVLSVVLLSSFSPSNDEDAKRYGERVLIWGTLDTDVFRRTISDIQKSDEGFDVVEYRQIDARTFDSVLVSAIAEGNSPDLILLSNSELVRQRNRLLALTYDTIPEREFRDTYIDGAEVFSRSDGIYAVPALVDPIVMYWNRDLFSSNGLAQAPTTWEQIVSTVAPVLTRRDNTRTILQSTVAFGEVRNVMNAKEILLLLAMQSGSSMIYEDRNQYQVELNKSVATQGLPPLEAAVQFFTSFSNANSQLYSWNRSQPQDRTAFISGDLALYFGYASELDNIEAQNPNLNFDMAPVPQGAAATVKRTYGEFYGFAIPKASKNVQGSYAVARVLASPSVALSLSKALGIAPATRSAIATGGEDAFRQIIFKEALIARGWLDPSSAATDTIFQDMIEDVSSGRKTSSVSVSDTEKKIRLAF